MSPDTLRRLEDLVAIPDERVCWCAPGIGEVGADFLAHCRTCGRVMRASSIGALVDLELERVRRGWA